MSEPFTPEKAIARLNLLIDNVRDGEYAKPIADLIRTLAARNAELELAYHEATCPVAGVLMAESAHENEDRLEASLREMEREREEYMLENGAFQAGLQARIRELEEAARWRSCKDEPPGESGFYLIQWNRDDGSTAHRVAHFLAEKDRRAPKGHFNEFWSVGMSATPDEWKPIV